MNLENFVPKAQKLLESTEQEIQAIILACDGEDISIINYGTDDMRARMIAQFISEESEEFLEKIMELIESK